MSDSSDHHLVYFADPMCSWCYGFAPVISVVAAQFGTRLPIDLMMGGLRAGETRPMRDKDMAYIRETWTRVHEASGQPFDFGFLHREGFVYDTEPACRAVVTVRALEPAQALSFKTRVSRAFYAEGRDTTSETVLADVAEEAGIDRAAFEAAFASPAARDATLRDFTSARRLGIAGFPTLLAGNRRTNQYAVVTNGYRPLADLPEVLERWLAAKAGT